MLSSANIPSTFSTVTPSIECVGNEYSSLHTGNPSKIYKRQFPIGIFHIYSKNTMQLESGIAIIHNFLSELKSQGLYWMPKYSNSKFIDKKFILVAYINAETDMCITDIPSTGIYYPDKSFSNEGTYEFIEMPTWNMQIQAFHQETWKSSGDGLSFPISKIHDPRSTIA